MREMIAVVKDQEGKEVNCTVLRVDTFLVPKSGKVSQIGREMVMESETVLTLLRITPNGYGAIGTCDAKVAKLQVVNIGSMTDLSWATFQ
jgi:hypothetical protein